MRTTSTRPAGATFDDTLASLAAPGDVVAIVGAGGKTTTMFALASALAARGLRVVTTKSTVIHKPTLRRGPPVVVSSEERWAEQLPPLLAQRRTITVVVAEPSDRRWDGVPPASAQRLLEASGADVAIVEADGARGRLVKAPDSHEPAMPPAARVVMPVASLLAIGRAVQPCFVHRPERVCAVLGIGPDTTLTGDHLAALLVHAEGGLKSVPVGARIWPVLTGADKVDRGTLTRITTQLAAFDRVIGWVTAVSHGAGWHYHAERVRADPA